jgi:hypothetical protein
MARRGQKVRVGWADEHVIELSDSSERGQQPHQPQKKE